MILLGRRPATSAGCPTRCSDRWYAGERVALLTSRTGAVCACRSSPTKRLYTAHGLRNRVEQGFVRPYGISYGVFAVLVEYRAVLNGRGKSGGVLGDRTSPDDSSQRPTIEALGPRGGSSCAFAGHRSSRTGELHRRLRSAKSVCSEPWGFPYGLAESCTENPQVMGKADKTHGSWGCGSPLPDELQKSLVRAVSITDEAKPGSRKGVAAEYRVYGKI